MQPVEIKPRRTQKRGPLILLALLLLAAIAVVYYLTARPSQTRSVNPEGDESSLTLLDYDEAQISSLTISPQRSEPYTLIRDQDSLKLADHPDYPLREETIRILAYYATHLTADERLTGIDCAAEPAWDAYALSDSGVCSAEVVLNDGKQYTITLGSAAPLEEIRYYMRLSNDDHVYTVTADVMDALNVPFYALHPVTRPSVSGELIDRISIKGKYDFTAERSVNGWFMTVPFSYPLKSSAMETLLSSLEGIRFSTWTAEANAGTRREYGFDPPALTLSMDFAASVLTVPDEAGETQVLQIPESNITIEQGNAYSNTADYYLYDGSIMTGTVVTFSFLKSFDWRKYIADTPLIYEQNNLSKLTVTVDDHKEEYQITYVERILPNNEFDRDEDGNILFEMRVASNGKRVEPTVFSEWYAKLAAAGGKMLHAPVPLTKDDSPSATLELYPENGENAILISLCREADDQYRLYVNGTAVMSVGNEWLELLRHCPS